MPVETAQYIHQLEPANPSGADKLSSGDDHIRMLKAALKATFPNIKGAVNLSHDFLNGLVNAALPVGIIMLFSGATAPLGWAICDGGTYPKADGSGTIVSPDLRGRVAVGVSSTHPLGEQFGQATKTVSSEAGGGHTHTGSTAAGGGHAHHVDLSGQTDDTAVVPNVTTFPHQMDGTGNYTTITGVIVTEPAHHHGVHLQGDTSPVGDHAHTLNLDGAPGHSHQVSVDVTQPSLALNYIIKL